MMGDRRIKKSEPRSSQGCHEGEEEREEEDEEEGKTKRPIC